MKQKTPFKTEFCSDRDRIRTYDRLLRRQMLYPAELRDLLLISATHLNLIVPIGNRNALIQLSKTCRK